MFFPSRIEAPHARIVGYPIYGQHVGRGPGIYRVGIGVPAQIIETGNHRVLKPLVYHVFAPEIAHPVLNPLKIGNGHPSRIRQNIRDNEDSFVMKNLVRRRGRVVVGTRTGNGWLVVTGLNGVEESSGVRVLPVPAAQLGQDVFMADGHVHDRVVAGVVDEQGAIWPAQHRA